MIVQLRRIGFGIGMKQLEVQCGLRLTREQRHGKKREKGFLYNSYFATDWINSQKQQQQAEDPSQPLSAQTFVIGGVQFREGTQRTPIDACAINRYNGVYHGWVIYWRNRTENQPGAWCVQNRSTQYVSNVIEKVEE